MHNTLNIIQISLSILLITSILLQHRGTGLGGAFGSEGNVYRSKRGLEKLLYIISMIAGIAFVGITLANIFL